MALYISLTCNVCPLYIPFTFNVHPLYVPLTCNVRPLYIPLTCTVCPLSTSVYKTNLRYKCTQKLVCITGVYKKVYSIDVHKSF